MGGVSKQAKTCPVMQVQLPSPAGSQPAFLNYSETLSNVLTTFSISIRCTFTTSSRPYTETYMRYRSNSAVDLPAEAALRANASTTSPGALNAGTTTSAFPKGDVYPLRA